MNIRRTIRNVLPHWLFVRLLIGYHFLLAYTAAMYYRYPSRKLIVVGVTGTKGKSSTCEILNAIFEATGEKTALISTIRFKIGDRQERNLLKMTVPGRFLLQKLLRDAVDAGCTYAVVEMSSEGAVQFRQRFVHMDALVFTHLTPEHVESHGSLKNYINAKLSIGKTLLKSSKRPRIIVANKEDTVGGRFLALPVEKQIPFSITDIAPYQTTAKGGIFTFKGVSIHTPLPGLFNLWNIAGAVSCADALDIPLEVMQKGVEGLSTISGRMEEVRAGQPFRVLVDYAHTKESLEAAYGGVDAPRICVLGNTGGGRDTWKRPLMAKTAETHCEKVILTNEDPYDEDPMEILLAMKSGMHTEPEIILDRTLALRRACELGKENSKRTIIVTGKGTDPFIMGPNGTKIAWDDREVLRAVLSEMGYDAKR